MALKVAVLNGDMKLKEAVLSEFAAQGLEVELSARGEVAISVREDAQGSSDEKLPSIDEIVTQRLKALNDKNFAEADRIRDELASQGIQLKDSKDSETGERVTTWEVKR